MEALNQSCWNFIMFILCWLFTPVVGVGILVNCIRYYMAKVNLKDTGKVKESIMVLIATEILVWLILLIVRILYF